MATGERPPGLDARVYHSLDGGRTWQRITANSLPGHYRMVPVVLFAENSALIMTDQGQIFRASDPRDRWTLVDDLSVSIHAASADGSPCSVSSVHE